MRVAGQLKFADRGNRLPRLQQRIKGDGLRIRQREIATPAIIQQVGGNEAFALGNAARPTYELERHVKEIDAAVPSATDGRDGNAPIIRTLEVSAPQVSCGVNADTASTMAK